ncbi:hypothetical protein, partial [Enterobacter intestinihominis]
PTGCGSCRTPVGGCSAPAAAEHAQKNPPLLCAVFFKNLGDGGFLNPHNLPFKCVFLKNDPAAQNI